jgi:iron complex outermembrane receptor protein
MKLNKSLILAGTALVTFGVTTHAFAQTTASQDIEVVVKGSRKGAGPINKETGVKTRSVIDQQYISSQSTGQSIAQSLNVVPLQLHQ